MNFTQGIEIIKQMDGNYSKRPEEIYILPSNMIKFPQILENIHDMQGILVTPFLIDIKNETVYELYYYEFGLEVCDVPKSYYEEYNKNNCLPEEIINNIKPRANVSKSDKPFFIKALNNYLLAMQKMQFNSERQFEDLKNSSMYYAIY